MVTTFYGRNWMLLTNNFKPNLCLILANRANGRAYATVLH